MELNRATNEDYESIIAFYDDVTDRTPDMEQYARWKKGSHPTHDGIRVIREAIRLAQTDGMKAIRLDALASNTPAHKIYKALGFEYRGQQHLYAENTGWTDFYFFEYKNHTIYETRDY